MKDLQFELLAGAMEHARVGLCVVDDAGRIVFLNHAFASKLEIKIDEVLGTGFLTLQRSLGRHDDFFKLFRTIDPETSIEFRVERQTGIHYLLLQSSNLIHRSGEVFRTVSLMDVSDYGVSRDKLHELRRQLDALNSAVVIVDAQTPDMPISYVNDHFEKLTGYSYKETVGRNCRFLQGTGTDQATVDRLRQSIKKRESCRVIIKNYRKDGSAFDNELYISPVFDAQGVLTHFIGMQREVASRSIAEGQ